MDRRDFAKTVALKAGAVSVLAVVPGAGLIARPASAKRVDPGLLNLSRAILKQNLLQAGEKLVVATGYSYDQPYVTALLQAGAEMGAASLHVPVFPRFEGDGERMRAGITRTHAEIFADADLLIDFAYGREPGTPGAGVGSGKLLDHQYRTDRQYMMSPESKTRWLSLGGGMSDTPRMQRAFFPTEEIRARTLRGVLVFHEGRQLHITSPHGTDVVMSIDGRVGHTQYGIADAPGRWDNFGTALVAAAPVETSTEGVIVYVPGDDIRDVEPRVLPPGETVTLTYGRAGQITRIDGGRLARAFEEYLSRTDHPDITRMAHVGYGTDPRIRGAAQNRLLGNDSIIDGLLHSHHHNAWGVVMIALGRNDQYHGGPHNNYSGLGVNAANAAPFHPHTALIQNPSLSVDGVKMVEDGQLVGPAL